MINKNNENNSKNGSVVNNNFPIDAFPDKVREIIQSTEVYMNFPQEFIGSSILYGVSVALGNSCVLEVKKGYEQNGSIYLALVGRAGINKSHPLSFAIKPILDQDQKEYVQYMQQVQVYNAKKKSETKLTVRPRWKRRIMNDYTPESLVEQLSLNPNGLGVYCDELAGWFKNFNRYNKGSEQEFWLSNWSGKSITVDRKSGEPIFIPKPFVSVGGTIQSRLLHSLFDSNRSDNGFIPRVLFAYREESKKKSLIDKEMPGHIEKNWAGIISKLMNNDFGGRVIRFEMKARKRFYLFEKVLTKDINNEDDDAIREIYSKLEMHTIRMSLLLEMLDYACGRSKGEFVSLKSVEGAISLVEYFRECAVKVHNVVSKTDKLKGLALDKKEFYDDLPYSFTTKEGILIASGFNIPERTCKFFLSNSGLFNRVKMGSYTKV